MKRMKQLKVSAGEEEIIQQGMFYCPYGREHYQCFFLWLQKRTLQEKMEWYKKLTPTDKCELIQCHRGCKEGKPMNPNRIKWTQHN
ncbi:MAG: hypothetical protein ACP5PZ_10040 [Bacteroidales bacterium]